MKIFENAKFISCEDNNKIFNILIEDKGKIIFTGNEIPDRYKRINNRINLSGKCVLPAFIDTHIHFSQFAFLNSGADISLATNIEEVSEILFSYQKKNLKGKYIVAFGCSENSLSEGRLPYRYELDKISQKPILIIGATGHSGVANTSLIQMFTDKALSGSGFDDSTGYLYKEALNEAIDVFASLVSPIKYLKSFSSGASYLAAQGISTVHTVEGIGYPMDLDVDMVRIFSAFTRQNFRVYFQTMNIGKVTRRRMNRIGGCFATALDGSLGTRDAALTDPYNNDTTNTGHLFYKQNKVDEFVINANRKNLQVSLHAVGDAAVEQALTAFERALKDYPRQNHRHIIIHAELITPRQIEKAAKLGVHFAVQTAFLHWKHEPSNYLYNLLGERVKLYQPIKSMINNGLVIGNGSDAPCMMPNPIQSIHSVCNHPNLEERIPVLDALRMQTNWASKLTFDEKNRGTLSEGKIADIVVLDSNPLLKPIQELNKMKVHELYIKGKNLEIGNIISK